jgi:hypothetical protein
VSIKFVSKKTFVFAFVVMVVLVTEGKVLAADTESDAGADAIEDINENFGTEGHPFYLNVPGESSTGDDGTIDPGTASKFLKEKCLKYQDKKIRKVIRARTLAMLKQIEASGIRSETDHEASPAEKKKILAERKKIRAELTDHLNKDCP